MRTLVLGIGNPILSDDGVGVHVVELLRKEVDDGRVDFREESTCGLDLIELVRGYDKLIIVDAIQTKEMKVGEIRRLTPTDLSDSGTLHFSTLHDVDIIGALALGKKIGGEMPEEVVFYAIEVENVRDFGEELTPAVRRSVPKAAAMIREELSGL